MQHGSYVHVSTYNQHQECLDQSWLNHCNNLEHTSPKSVPHLLDEKKRKEYEDKKILHDKNFFITFKSNQSE